MASSSTATPRHRQRLARLATSASVALALILIGIKLLAWLATGSISLLSSTIDSTLDLAASALNFIAVRRAWAPADRNHRFGHGKAEPLAGLAQGAFMIGAALLVLAEAAARLIAPAPITASTLGITVMVVSLVLTLALVVLQRHVARVSGSVAVEADSLHYTSDILANALVIVALLGADLGLLWLDPLIGAGIAIFLLISAWRVVRRSIDLLMDRELPDSVRAEIRRIVAEDPDVSGVHQMRSRASGTHRFAEIELAMAGALPLLEAHRISHRVMRRLHEAFPDLDVVIHQEPEEECWLDEDTDGPITPATRWVEPDRRPGP